MTAFKYEMAAFCGFVPVRACEDRDRNIWIAKC